MIDGDEGTIFDDQPGSTQPLELLDLAASALDFPGRLLSGEQQGIVRNRFRDLQQQAYIGVTDSALPHPLFCVIGECNAVNHCECPPLSSR